MAVVGYFPFNCGEPDGMQRVNIYISVKRTLLVSLFLCIITLRLIAFANFSHSLAESNDFRFIHSDMGLLRETESLPGGPIKNHPVAATKIIANIALPSFRLLFSPSVHVRNSPTVRPSLKLPKAAWSVLFQSSLLPKWPPVTQFTIYLRRRRGVGPPIWILRLSNHSSRRIAE